MTLERAMDRAIALSRRGYPAPNPRVGCVIVRDGEIVGEGFHPYAGAPHAEVFALREAGDKARGATAVVTLEPCAHTGRTPPCAEALIEAGIKEVVVAVRDPNPRAAGGGAWLERHGISVTYGIRAQRAASANEVFLQAHALGRPFVVAKAAMTLDGRIALPDGRSRWITGDRARREAHRLRAELGCVLVGRGTVAADDPLLTARLRGVHHPPVRVVLDPRARLNGTERIFGPEAPTLRFVGGSSTLEADRKAPLRAGELDLGQVLGDLWSEGITGVLVEGGGVTLARFLKAQLVDRLELFVAPKVLGAGPAWATGEPWPSLEASPSFDIRRVRRLGPDVQITAVPRRHKGARGA
ncbi:MAG: bifunctional diaminohydroxyphosphoribosylaminopyrimidine deaminase/5-amino-6-(5-phosphoribosylamino)uracil reductase RibD [Chthonomonadaceae bacterium]|nr:bifunctional diaminohydroxyphosphoribosylaminopyrimidine deaminase/5-amino-6-(5-phosphoribosylamino)uracil reductase RibD [Chthonomonadaceae bacterium]